MSRHTRGGTSLFGDWWLRSKKAGDLVILAQKSWWFGDSKNVWWWWFTSKKFGDLVILPIKGWWFGDFGHTNLTISRLTFRMSTFRQNGEKYCQIDGLPSNLKEFSPYTTRKMVIGDFSCFWVVKWWKWGKNRGEMVIQGGVWSPPYPFSIYSWYNLIAYSILNQ